MFRTDCPHLDREVLVREHQIDSLTSTSHGIAVEFSCFCGGCGVYLIAPQDNPGRLIFHGASLSLAA